MQDIIYVNDKICYRFYPKFVLNDREVANGEFNKAY